MGKMISLRRDGYKVEGEAVRIAMDKPRRRRWNWRRALGNVLSLLALIAVGVWYGWAILLPWWTGSSW